MNSTRITPLSGGQDRLDDALVTRSGQWQRCPVCGGNGIVPNGFYSQTSGQWTTASTTPEQCRTCAGRGIVR